jgi:hypothetical protein
LHNDELQSFGENAFGRLQLSRAPRSRLLEAFDVSVLRLVRVAIGTLALGTVAAGQWRLLPPAEILHKMEIGPLMFDALASDA